MKSSSSLYYYYLLINLYLLIDLKINSQLISQEEKEKDLNEFIQLNCLNPLVSVDVFSTQENPIWKIPIQQLNQIKHLMTNFLQNDDQQQQRFLSLKTSQRIVGYRGFILTCSNNKSIHISGLNSIEKQFLETGRSYLSSTIIEHIIKHIGERIIISNQSRILTRINCDRVPIKGSDHVPIYNPQTSNGGCFIKKQSKNNCYAYGTNIVTNTFPQPGRYSGKKLSSITCESVRKAAVLDGLVYNGTIFPRGHPKSGHFLALLIWPNADYHWIRKDSNGYWSHKPGAGPITNKDNMGSIILNPSKSNLSPWKLFCGYYIAQPSKINIT